MVNPDVDGCTENFENKRNIKIKRIVIMVLDMDG